jgi:RNA-directed DNA polymerase
VIALRGTPGGPATPTQHIACASRLEPPACARTTGAPTSPALASLAAHGLDRRLAALAPTLGPRYSRYADDLTFSGDADLPAGTLARAVADVARDEGFRIVPAKTGVRRRNERQLVCGVVVNERLNVPRTRYDRLKAILHDAAHHGPAAANRDDVSDFRAHLQGRIAWVGQLHPPRGEKLQARFDAIAW